MFAWVIPLLTLTAMEVVLGIDNIIFIALVAGRLPAGQQATARRLGLGLALVSRLLLLGALSWMLGLTRPLFTLSDVGLPAGWLPPGGNEISWRDLILIVGGLFLIGKSVYEIHDKLEGASHESPGGPIARGPASSAGRWPRSWRWTSSSRSTRSSQRSGWRSSSG